MLLEVHERSPDSDTTGRVKRIRRDTSRSGSTNLPAGDELLGHQTRYAEAVPYKYAAVGALLNDEIVSRGVMAKIRKTDVSPARERGRRVLDVWLER